MDYLLFIVFSGYFILALALLICIIAVEWILFERAGEPGWKVLIPFYDSFIRHKISSNNKMSLQRTFFCNVCYNRHFVDCPL